MKVIKVFIFLISFVLFMNNTYASNINTIKVVDDKNVEFLFSEDVVFNQGNISGDIKFLKDIEVVFASKDFEDQNKLILNLAIPIDYNKTYSLLTIIGPDANIDFTTGSSLENFEIINNKQTFGEEQGLNRIVVKDSKTLELYFNTIVEDNDFEFKLLNELDIEQIVSKGGNIMNLTLENSLERLNNYLVMILSLKNNFGNAINLEEDLYEIKTSDELNPVNEELEEEIIKENSIDENTESKNVEKMKKIDLGEVEVDNIALNAAETPDTGPETTILIILTFVINTILFVRKKIIKA